MKKELANRLLAKVLNWNTENVSVQVNKIDMLSQMKYDEYQQYSPGLRFAESLARWLSQFEEDHRHLLFNFIMEKLIFISVKEMNLLVSQAYPDFIRPVLFSIVAKKNNISKYSVLQISKSKEYSELLRRTLFLGLSDGARTDVIRRFNPFISHEQVLPYYLIPEEKHEELLEELNKDLVQIRGFGKEEVGNLKFQNLVLLDDFTASGTSYFKYNENSQEFKGKVDKILKKILKDSLGNIFDIKDLNVLIIIYIATEQAVNVVNRAIEKWKEVNNSQIKITFKPVYELPESIITRSNETEFCSILKKYYDSGIETASYKKGKHNHPYLGFDECGLPIVLHHNTPNNSLTILWNESTNKSEQDFVGLFPRVSRHKK